MNFTYSIKTEWIAVATLLLLFFAAISPMFPGFEFDRQCWQQWATHVNAVGVHEAYDLPGNNYPPFYQYILRIYGKLNGDAESIHRNIAYLRVFTLLFEFWALWLVYKWLDRKPDFGYLLICSMLNVAYSYNVMLWGQVDGIMAALVFAMFYQISKGRLVYSAAFLVLALNMKLQALIYLPLWGLLMISALHRSRKWKQVPLLILTILGVQMLLLIPFTWGPGGLLRVWQVIVDLTDWYPFVSMNAYNMWYWIVEKDHAKTPDTLRILGITAKQLGLISFCTASFFAMYPVLRDTIGALRGRVVSISKETIWLSAALVTLSFFYFNTQMHERYAHGAFIFFTAYAFQRRSFGLYALFSVAYLLNLDGVFQGLRLPNYGTLIFDPRFVSALFAGCIGWAFMLMYRRPWLRQTERLPEYGLEA